MPKLESYKRVHTEELYFPNDQKLWKEQQEALVLLEKFNQTSVAQPEQQMELLKKCFQKLGKIVLFNPLFMLILAEKMFILGQRFMLILI